MKPTVRELRHRYFGNGRQHAMAVSVSGEWHNAMVSGEYQPEENDTNTRESVTLCAVYVPGRGDVLDQMTEGDIAGTETDLLCRFHNYCADHFDEAAEHSYAQRMERLLP